MTDFLTYLLFYNEDQRHSPTRRDYNRNGPFIDGTSQRHFRMVPNTRLPVSPPYDRQFPDSYNVFGIQGQPIFGYFQGGGWAFGTTENASHRISVEVYQAYLSAPSDQVTVIQLRRLVGERADSPVVLGANGQPEIIRIHIGEPPPNWANQPNAHDIYLPHVSRLSPLDRAGFDHDFRLAQIRREEASGTLSRSAAFTQEMEAHDRLIAFVNSYQPIEPKPGDFVELLGGYERAHQVYLNEVAQRDFVREWLPLIREGLEAGHRAEMTAQASLLLTRRLMEIAARHGLVFPAMAVSAVFGQCFGAGTPILLADGSTKPIEQIAAGDLVASYDPREDAGRGPLSAREVVRIFSSESRDAVDLNGLIMTSGHRVLTGSGEFRALGLLKESDLLVNADGSLRPVGWREDLRDPITVYNFEVEGLHTYVAGGIRVHNDSGTLLEGSRQVYARINEPGLPDMSFVYDTNSGVVQVTVNDAASGRTIQETFAGGQIIQAIYQNGSGSFGPEVFGLNAGVFAPSNVDLAALMRTEAFSRGVIFDYDLDRRIELGGDIAFQFGSTLGRLLSDDQLTSIALGVVLGTVARNLGEAIINDGFAVNWAVHLDSNVVDDFAAELGGAAVGAVSSYLVGELFNALGLEGELADLGEALTNGYVSRIAQNLVTPNSGIFEGLENVNPATIVGSFLGTWLGSKLIKFDTIGGQVGSSLGSTVGAIIGTAMLKEGAKLLFQVLLPGIGAFIGYIVGGLIGSLFGGTPKAGAALAWNENEQEFRVVNVWSKNQGPKDAVRSFATQVGEMLNGVIAASGSRLIDVGGVQAGSYEVKGKKYWYKPNASGPVSFVTKDVGQLVNHGAFIAISDLSERLMGGDVYIKRAVAATVAQSGGNRFAAGYAAGDFEANTLFGNIATAQDYAQYLQNPAMINALIAAEPSSAFTAGWTITFARVLELGLDRRWKSDWLGGWAAFLDETADGKIDGTAFAPANWVANDNEFSVMAAA